MPLSIWIKFFFNEYRKYELYVEMLEGLKGGMNREKFHPFLNN